MRFQDAAKDARAVVYAGIQADPQVARTAALLADATPAQRVLARAVMNGETTDAGRLASDVPEPVRPGATGDAGDEARSEDDPRPRPSRSPTGASRSAARSGAPSSRS